MPFICCCFIYFIVNFIWMIKLKSKPRNSKEISSFFQSVWLQCHTWRHGGLVKSARHKWLFGQLGRSPGGVSKKRDSTRVSPKVHRSSRGGIDLRFDQTETLTAALAVSGKAEVGSSTFFQDVNPRGGNYKWASSRDSRLVSSNITTETWCFSHHLVSKMLEASITAQRWVNKRM